MLLVCQVRSLGLWGVQGYEVTAECDLSKGLPGFEIVGLPDAAVKEARERVRSAARNSGFTFPVTHITVNLAPADRKKAGTVYDLPIWVGILTASGQLPERENDCAAFVGELSLSGQLRPVPGMLPMALAAARAGIKELYVPANNAPEATLADGLTVYPVSDVAALAAHLLGEKPIQPAPRWHPTVVQPAHSEDFSDVKGQTQVKRGLEVAAAGGHSVLMSGSPGSGKSMLAHRLPTILPDMTREEALAATEIYSIMGMTSQEKPMITQRPFRAPHHTISNVGMVGGGTNPGPGEISLAHNGVLFLDELPEFHTDVLEVLRQPLEDGSVQISRAAGSVVFPARFMLVCAMNPCKCGWYGHPSGRCRCTKAAVEKYVQRISGPLLDRIDLCINVPSLEFEELAQESEPSESSADIRERVNAARARQTARFGPDGPSCNAYMGTKELRKWCKLDEYGEKIMQSAFERLGLTARGYDRVLRVARTIADLDGVEKLSAHHLAEALQYRGLPFLRR